MFDTDAASSRDAVTDALTSLCDKFRTAGAGADSIEIWMSAAVDGAAAARFNAFLIQVLGDFRRVLL